MSMNREADSMFSSESQLWRALKEIIRGSLHESMKALCEHYLSSKDYNEIYNTLSTVEPIEQEVRKLLFTDGYGIELKEGSLFHAVRTVIRTLEDLLLNAMEGTDVSELERKGLLLYQAVPDVVLQ
ncbi:hypothetical protein JVT61DRAFT_1787 [Boletus reticuloceps]|uniref:Uncharacterized protein n=1 Tax=Boletus reticuloceps TaxID=495285 RepID=A0A8I2YQS3_9AGAM|nr:hypothetical protein JVT61DRAFT_1787 [Boletus reticuloceps]